MKHCMLLALLSAYLPLAASEPGLIENSDFRQGLSGFRTNTVPAGKEGGAFRTGTMPDGKPGLKIVCDPGQAEVANLVIPTLGLTPGIPYDLKCRISIAPAEGEKETGGQFHFRVREWKGDKLLRNSLMIWGTFSAPEGLKVVACRDNREMGILNEKSWTNRSYELSSTGMFSESADHRDFILSVYGKPRCTVMISGLQLKKTETPPIRLLTGFDSITLGKKEISLEVETAPEGAKTCSANFELIQGGNTVWQKEFTLAKGKNLLSIPTEKLVRGTAEMRMRTGDFEKKHEFKVEDDPFAAAE